MDCQFDGAHLCLQQHCEIQLLYSVAEQSSMVQLVVLFLHMWPSKNIITYYSMGNHRIPPFLFVVVCLSCLALRFLTTILLPVD